MSQDKSGFNPINLLRKLSLWHQLALLVLATIIPLLLLGWFMFNRMTENERAGLRRDIVLNTRITAALVENEIETHSAIASTLAHSPSLQAGDLAAFWQEATNALRFTPGAWITVSDPSGQILLTTLGPIGTAYPKHVQPELLKRGFETGKPQVSDLVLGPVSKKITAFVDVPVFRDTVPIYSISISLAPDRFHALVKNQFTHGEIVAVLDRNMKFVTRMPDHDARLGKLPSDEWRASIAEKSEGWVESKTVDGHRSLSGYTRISHGWTVAVAILETDIALPLGKILLSSAGLALALSIISIWMAWLIARNASGGITELAQSAWYLAHNKPLPLINPPFAEAKLIAQSLEQASNELIRQNTLLLSANLQLEAKVEQSTQDLTSEVRQRENIETTLRQSQKMESIGQLTGGIAHDFNNMLTIVIGNLDTIQRRVAKMATASSLIRPVEGALQGARSAAKLTHRLLAFSRQQTLQPEPLDLNSVIVGITDMLSRTVGEAITIQTFLEEELWLTLADANQIENTLVNLAINSRDAMDGRGKLTIETSNIYLDKSYVPQFYDLKVGQYVMINVTDTGSGIAAEQLDKVFEPFFTTKEPGKGTGLGLAMIYGFVKQSGGYIRLQSDVGQGTSVKIYLPKFSQISSAGLEPRAAQVPQTPVPQALEGETILLVEDDKGVLEYATGALEELGYQVVSASSGQEALEKLETMPRIDLLFTDIVLGGSMDGTQLSQHILEKLPNLPVLFTTGYSRSLINNRDRLDEGVNLLNKPYTLEELAGKLRFARSGKCRLTA